MRQLDCRRAKRLIVRDLDEGLDQREAVLLAEHLNQCPTCRLFMGETSGVLSLVASDVPADPGDDFWRRYRVSLDAKVREQDAARVGGLPWKALTAIAATIVVLIAAYGTIFGPVPTLTDDGKLALAVLEDLNQVFGADEAEEVASPSLQDFTLGALAAQQPSGYEQAVAGWFEVDDEPDNLVL